MKRNLFTMMALTLCLCLIVPTAMAGGGGYPYGESFPGDPGCGPMTPPAPQTTVTTGADVHVDVHVDVDVSVTTCVHHPGCPHWHIFEYVEGCADDNYCDMKKAWKISGDRAKHGIKTLRTALKTTNWTVKECGELYALDCNGYKFLVFTNKKYGLEEKYLINAYTHRRCKPDGTLEQKRWIIFTTSHLGGKFSEYPCEFKITSEEVYETTAIGELLIHLKKLEDEAASQYLVVDEPEGECGG